MKRPCRVRSSNAGPCPVCRRYVARKGGTRRGNPVEQGRLQRLGHPDPCPGAKHATIPCLTTTARSIWPHDNAAIAIGLARYNLKQEAARVFTGLFDAAKEQEMRRLPELFCGFIRRPGRGPTPYPVACSPQAWAASALFGVLGACLGLEQAHTKMRSVSAIRSCPHSWMRLCCAISSSAHRMPISGCIATALTLPQMFWDEMATPRSLS